jgi:hypothetical protein
MAAETGDPPEVRLLPETLGATTWYTNLNVLARAINPIPPRSRSLCSFELFWVPLSASYIISIHPGKTVDKGIII